MTLERRREGLVLEALRQQKPAHASGVGVEISKDLVHAAVLCIQHPLHLRLIQRRQHALGPFSKRRLDFQRQRVGGVTIRIAQSGVGLVQRIPRRPEAIQIETAGLDLAFGQSCERVTKSFQRANVSVAVFALHDFQFAHDVVGSGLEPHVAGGLVHIRHRGEVMSCDVSGEIASAPIPPCIRRSLRRQSGPLPIERQHPIGIECEQICRGEILRMLERTAGQAYPVERNGMRAQPRNRRAAIRCTGI